MTLIRGGPTNGDPSGTRTVSFTVNGKGPEQDGIRAWIEGWMSVLPNPGRKKGEK